jgi:hypothetical protein
MIAIGIFLGIAALLLIVNRESVADLFGNSKAKPIRQLPLKQSVLQTTAQEDQDTYEPINIEEIIDNIAGHPDDPQLPKESIGASDEVLAATDPREVGNVLQQTQAFARSHSQEPRFMFALGRAALFHGYQRLGVELLQAAASNGSGAAYAYLGFLAEDEGDENKAARLLKLAQKNGFNTAEVQSSLINLNQTSSSSIVNASQTAPLFDPKAFNQPELIAAFYRKDMKFLSEKNLYASFYGSRIHATIWEGGDILFMTEHPKILLELDPGLSARAGYRLSSSPEAVNQMTSAGWGILQNIVSGLEEFGKGQSMTGDIAKLNKAVGKYDVQLALLQEQATQDARRLVLMYDENPEILRRVYAGIKAFIQ